MRERERGGGGGGVNAGALDGLGVSWSGGTERLAIPHTHVNAFTWAVTVNPHTGISSISKAEDILSPDCRRRKKPSIP